MIGTVQLGLLAACVVVLVPMGLAGWHLSRNKMLFFGGALFISLAVAVHLFPYFPSLSSFIPDASSFSSSSVVILKNRDSCLPLLHEIEWNEENYGYNRSVLSWGWGRSDGSVIACDFQKLRKYDARDLLNGSWVMVAGDSQARLFVLSLLNVMLGEEEMESVRRHLFKRHSNYQAVVDGVEMKLDFIWAPYVTNLIDLIVDLSNNKSCPDVLVMGTGLWHMLHITNSTDYGMSLQRLHRSLMSFLMPVSLEFGAGPDLVSVSARPRAHLFWLGMPMLINSMLNTEEKREKMTNETQDAYNDSLHGSKLLHQSQGPFLLLDIHALSKNCGVHCTEDGMHYSEIVYEAAVQITLNALLIESQQKL
ncbi:hypothetical protein Nepgr_013129 [Nepenthes gracilis]|uniref:PC-Esterase n=1 Tax=Nepenthes gracilis TaxID=150966 RepID=A0AAD3SH85_NEPGR|nr:hypothetical protein Nepgr_013129 [Nepenthes gracilis]